MINWENLGIAFASSFLGSIVKLAGLKMNEKGEIITETGGKLSLAYVFKKTIFGVGCGVAFVGFISEMIGKEEFNWVLIIGFLIGYGGEHFLPIVIKAIGNFIKVKGKIYSDNEGTKLEDEK